MSQVQVWVFGLSCLGITPIIFLFFFELFLHRRFPLALYILWRPVALIKNLFQSAVQARGKPLCAASSGYLRTLTFFVAPPNFLLRAMLLQRNSSSSQQHVGSG